MIILLLLFLKTGELCTVRAALGFGDIPSGVEFYGKCTEMGIMKLPSELEEYQSIQFEKGTKIFKKSFMIYKLPTKYLFAKRTASIMFVDQARLKSHLMDSAQ